MTLKKTLYLSFSFVMTRISCHRYERAERDRERFREIMNEGTKEGKNRNCSRVPSGFDVGGLTLGVCCGGSVMDAVRKQNVWTGYITREELFFLSVMLW